MKVTVEITRPGWMTPARLRRARPLVVLLLALVFVAPVLASDRFSDVPTSSVHHDDVNTIAVAGITQGCNPPANTLYCPSDAVRRDQMASFLQRGLGRASRGVGSPGFTSLTTSFQTMATATMTVPGSGFVIVNGSTTIGAFGGSSCPCTAQVRLRDTTSGLASPIHYEGVEATLAYSSMGTTYVFPVAAGTRSFVLEAAQYTSPGGTGPFGPFNTIIDVLWVPFGSSGASTLGSAEPEASRGGIAGAP